MADSHSYVVVYSLRPYGVYLAVEVVHVGVPATPTKKVRLRFTAYRFSLCVNYLLLRIVENHLDAESLLALVELRYNGFALITGGYR